VIVTIASLHRITHPYPNFLFLGHWGTPSFPPVKSQVAASAPVARSPDLTALARHRRGCAESEKRAERGSARRGWQAAAHNAACKDLPLVEGVDHQAANQKSGFYVLSGGNAVTANLLKTRCSGVTAVSLLASNVALLARVTHVLNKEPRLADQPRLTHIPSDGQRPRRRRPITYGHDLEAGVRGPCPEAEPRRAGCTLARDGRSPGRLSIIGNVCACRCEE
jgi:hypothetical protein